MVKEQGLLGNFSRTSDGFDPAEARLKRDAWSGSKRKKSGLAHPLVHSQVSGSRALYRAQQRHFTFRRGDLSEITKSFSRAAGHSHAYDIVCASPTAPIGQDTCTEHLAPIEDGNTLSSSVDILQRENGGRVHYKRVGLRLY